MQRTGFRVRRPYLLVTLIVVLIAAVNLISFGVMNALPAVPPDGVELFAELILAVLAIALLTALRSWRTVGFRAFSRLSDLRLYWIPLFPVLPVVAAAVAGMSRMRFEEFVFFLVLACLIGFVEEVFFRGLILRVLVPAGLWRAAVLSSILFGLLHLLNLLSGADLAVTLVQAVYATAMGFGFAAVTLRTGVLWPLIVIHALIDFAGFTTSGETVLANLSSTDITISILYIVVFTVYGILLLRPLTRPAAQHRPSTGSAEANGPGPDSGPFDAALSQGR